MGLGRGRCKICPDESSNRFLLVLGVVAVIAGATGLIVLTIKSEGVVLTVSEATKKIALNYLQVVSLAALFPMQWPDELSSFFAAQSAISSASQALLSPDCELSWMTPAEAFYQKQIGFSLLPLFIVFICKTVWFAAKEFKCRCGYVADTNGSNGSNVAAIPNNTIVLPTTTATHRPTDDVCIHSLFQLIDQNSDGKITKLEILSAIMRRRMREPELNQAFLNLLQRFPKQAKKLLHPKSSKLVLKSIDTDNDNIITEREMLNYCITPT